MRAAEVDPETIEREKPGIGVLREFHIPNACRLRRADGLDGMELPFRPESISGGGAVVDEVPSDQKGFELTSQVQEDLPDTQGQAEQNGNRTRAISFEREAAIRRAKRFSSFSAAWAKQVISKADSDIGAHTVRRLIHDVQSMRFLTIFLVLAACIVIIAISHSLVSRNLNIQEPIVISGILNDISRRLPRSSSNSSTNACCADVDSILSSSLQEIQAVPRGLQSAIAAHHRCNTASCPNDAATAQNCFEHNASSPGQKNLVCFWGVDSKGSKLESSYIKEIAEQIVGSSEDLSPAPNTARKSLHTYTPTVGDFEVAVLWQTPSLAGTRSLRDAENVFFTTIPLLASVFVILVTYLPTQLMSLASTSAAFEISGDVNEDGRPPLTFCRRILTNLRSPKLILLTMSMTVALAANRVWDIKKWCHLHSPLECSLLNICHSSKNGEPFNELLRRHNPDTERYIKAMR